MNERLKNRTYTYEEVSLMLKLCRSCFDVDENQTVDNYNKELDDEIDQLICRCIKHI